MDITANNFIEKLGLIVKSIKTADFIAYDTEFSGLSVGFDDKQHDYDTIETKYQKLKHNCQRMNAFQIGLATFKWDHKLNKYVIRPFNFYVWPNSNLMNKSIMQFSTSNVNFLVQNNFDFNKLFKEGLCYQRISDKNLILKQIAIKMNESPQFLRSYTHLGSQSQNSLQEYVKQVQNFIQLANKNANDSQQYKVLELQIESHALKKQLAKELFDLYKDQRIIFTEYKKESSSFLVKKWAQQNKNEQEKEKKKQLDISSIIGSKFAVPQEKKENYILKYIDAKYKEAEVVYEDEKCIAFFENINPVSKIHVLIAPKLTDNKLKSLSEANLNHQALLGYAMAKIPNIVKLLNIENGYRVVINQGINGQQSIQTNNHLLIQIIGGQQLKWIFYQNKVNLKDQALQQIKDLSLQDADSLDHELQQPLFVTKKSDDKEEDARNRLKIEFYLSEYGFTNVVEQLILKYKESPNFFLIGHNLMYDIIYFYNQFVGPLPETYEEFIKKWHERFPRIFDTKVLSFQAEYFGKTALGNIYEKCKYDKKLNDIVDFQFDLKNGFKNYEGSELLSHYHEAAYDAYMTGYIFVKILKYKEIDQVYQQKKLEEKKQKQEKHKNKTKKNNDKETEKAQEEFQIVGNPEQQKEEHKESFKPQQLKNSKVDIEKNSFGKPYLNMVMLNQFDQCACFHMDPDRPDKNQIQSEEKHKNLVWIKFTDDFDAGDLSADSIAQVFSKFGDFQVYRDQKQSCILNFYHFDKNVLKQNNIEGFIGLMNSKDDNQFVQKIKDQLKIDVVCSYLDAPKFVAHNHLE